MKKDYIARTFMVLTLFAVLIAMSGCGRNNTTNEIEGVGEIGRGRISGTFINPNDRAESITFAGGNFEMNVRHRAHQTGTILGTYRVRGDTITISFEMGFDPPFDTGEVELRMDSDNDTIWFPGNVPLVSAIPGDPFPSLAGSEPTERSMGLLNMPRNEWITINGWTTSIEIPFTETLAIEVADLDPHGQDFANLPEHILRRIVNHGLVIRHITDDSIRTALDGADSYQEFHFDDVSIGWKLEREGVSTFINGNVLFEYISAFDMHNTFYNNIELIHAVARTLTRVPMVRVGTDPSIYVPVSWQVQHRVHGAWRVLGNDEWANYSGTVRIHTSPESSFHILEMTTVTRDPRNQNDRDVILSNLEYLFDSSRIRDYFTFASGDTGVKLTFPAGNEADVMWINNVFRLIHQTNVPLSPVAEMLVEEIADSFSVRNRNADGDLLVSLFYEGPEPASLEWQTVSTDYFAINIPTLWRATDLASTPHIHGFSGGDWEENALLLYGINFWNRNYPLAYRRLHDPVGINMMSEGQVVLAVGFPDERHNFQIMNTSAVEMVDFQFDDGNTGVMIVFRSSIYWRNGPVFLRYYTWEFYESGHSDTILAIARSLSPTNLRTIEIIDSPDNEQLQPQRIYPYMGALEVPDGWRFNPENGSVTAPAGFPQQRHWHMRVSRDPAPFTESSSTVTIEEFLFNDGNMGEKITHRPVAGTAQIFWINGDYRLQTTAALFNTDEELVSAIARSLTSTTGNITQQGQDLSRQASELIGLWIVTNPFGTWHEEIQEGDMISFYADGTGWHDGLGANLEEFTWYIEIAEGWDGPTVFLTPTLFMNFPNQTISFMLDEDIIFQDPFGDGNWVIPLHQGAGAPFYLEPFIP